MTPPKLLEVHLLSKWFGGVTAVSGVDLTIHEGEIVALIGPNGAGKTTLFNCLTGLYRPNAGKITLFQQGKPIEVTGKKPHLIAQLGLARTFQNIRLFGQLTVIENVMVGFHGRLKAGFWATLFGTRAQRQEERQMIAEAFDLLSLFGLSTKANQLASSLAYADQRRLEIARALACQPEILLLDEPAAGMNHSETAALETLIRKIRDDFKISILLIEHDMKLVMNLSDRVYVLDRGMKIAEGPPAKVSQNPKVIAAYLGEEV